MTEKIKIEGMGCAHCVTAVREALESVGDVEVQDVQIGWARVRFDDQDTRAKVDEVIRDAGYEPISHTAANGGA